MRDFSQHPPAQYAVRDPYLCFKNAVAYLDDIFNIYKHFDLRHQCLLVYSNQHYETYETSDKDSDTFTKRDYIKQTRIVS